MVDPNRRKYLASLSDELTVQAKRVRDLIGDVHWLSDGYHKEHLVRGLVTRHLPKSIRVTRGFVVSSNDPGICSREQDILILDADIEAPVFDQGDLVIAFPSSVVGSISVKTVLNSEELVDSCECANSVRMVAARDQVESSQIWQGAYFFERSTYKHATFHDTLLKYRSDAPRPTTAMHAGPPPPVGLDAVAAASDFLGIVVHEFVDHDSLQPAKLNLYDAGGLAPALLIASLLDHLAARRKTGHTSFHNFMSAEGVKAVSREGKPI